MGMSTHDIDAIVIGGSTGALEVLSVLLAALPSAPEVPLALVLHVPRSGPSHLAEVLGKRTAVPVKEVEDKEPVAGGTVYVAPANYHLLIERGRTFALSTDELLHFSRPAIDVLFESAADAYRERLAGVILSGANEDGARGLAAIQHGGGLAIVQTPESAQAPAMPRAALSSTRAAHALSIADLSVALAQLARGGRPGAELG
jgi:two-component system chemotaxis response regulator CheB